MTRPARPDAPPSDSTPRTRSAVRDRLLPALPLLGAVALAVALAGGCGGDTTPTAEDAPSSPSRGPGGSSWAASSSAPALSVDALPPPPADVDLGIEEVATRYLAARENAISYTHATPRDWLTDVRPVMTPAGWQRLAASVGDRGGFPATTARTRKWSVRVTVECRHNPDAGVAPRGTATLTCAVTDRTVDAAGVPVPVKNLPGIWPYDGPQPPALLAMRTVDGRWLVDADQTGRAG